MGREYHSCVRAYIEKVKQDIGNYAFFITSGNTDSEKIVNPIAEIIHKKPIAHAGFNSGELLNKEIYSKKLAAFINDIKKQSK